MHPLNIWISLGNRSLISVCYVLVMTLLYSSDQNVQMCRLTWVFVGHTCYSRFHCTQSDISCGEKSITITSWYYQLNFRNVGIKIIFTVQMNKIQHFCQEKICPLLFQKHNLFFLLHVYICLTEIIWSVFEISHLHINFDTNKPWTCFQNPRHTFSRSFLISLSTWWAKHAYQVMHSVIAPFL